MRIVSGTRMAAGHTDPSTLLYDMNAYAEESARLPLDVTLEFSGGAGHLRVFSTRVMARR